MLTRQAANKSISRSISQSLALNQPLRQLGSRLMPGAAGYLSLHACGVHLREAGEEGSRLLLAIWELEKFYQSANTSSSVLIRNGDGQRTQEMIARSAQKYNVMSTSMPVAQGTTTVCGPSCSCVCAMWRLRGKTGPPCHLTRCASA